MSCVITKKLTCKFTNNLISQRAVIISDMLLDHMRLMYKTHDIFNADVWKQDWLLQKDTFDAVDDMTNGSMWRMQRISAYPTKDKLRIIFTSPTANGVMIVTFTKSESQQVTLNDLHW